MSNPRGLLPSLELKSPNSSRLPSSSLSGLPCTRLRPAQAYQGILLKQRPNLTLFCSGPSHGYTTFFRSSPMSLWLPARLVCPAPGPSLTSPSFLRSLPLRLILEQLRPAAFTVTAPRMCQHDSHLFCTATYLRFREPD